jgi:ureidoacrylate peracid hydrolase
MHKLSIPKSVVDDVVRQRGRELVFDDLTPKTTALLVVDMQNGFLMKGVAHALCEQAIEIVPNINRIAGTLRKAGGLVVWIKNTANEDSHKNWSVRDAMDGPERTEKRNRTMAPGSKGHDLWADLDTRPGDLTVQKTRFSAFIQGSSNLEATLRTRGIDTVIVSGTVTNVCCESTARDAMMRNFRTIMVTDANAANSDDLHNAALIAFYLKFGDIMPTEVVVSLLSAARSRAPNPVVRSSDRLFYGPR